MIGLTKRGVYAITDSKLVTRLGGLSAAVESALRGGAVAIQYRDKGTERARRQREARALRSLCHTYGAPLIINDDVELAREILADGVHLGRDDLSVTEARKRLGADAIVGVSCYERAQRALLAEREGASYVAFGSFFPSPSKPAAVRVTVECLASVRARIGIPVVAIGGITAANATPVVAAGADLLAVISEIFAAADPEAATRKLGSLFAQDDTAIRTSQR